MQMHACEPSYITLDVSPESTSCCQLSLVMYGSLAWPLTQRTTAQLFLASVRSACCCKASCCQGVPKDRSFYESCIWQLALALYSRDCDACKRLQSAGMTTTGHCRNPGREIKLAELFMIPGP